MASISYPGADRKLPIRAKALPLPAGAPSVTPDRHCSFGFRLMIVSNTSMGAGSVAVCARPALPYIDSTALVDNLIQEMDRSLQFPGVSKATWMWASAWWNSQNTSSWCGAAAT